MVFMVPVYMLSCHSLSFIAISTGLSVKGMRVSSQQMPLVAKQMNSSKDKQIEGGGGSSSSSLLVDHRLRWDYVQSTRACQYLEATRPCKESDGILVPGAFGDRGTTRKITILVYVSACIAQ